MNNALNSCQHGHLATLLPQSSSRRCEIKTCNKHRTEYPHKLVRACESETNIWCLREETLSYSVSSSFELMVIEPCTPTAQSSRVGCSRRVHRIMYLAVTKGNILINILSLKIFFANYCHL